MGNVIYTAEAHVTGGRTDGRGRTSDGSLEIDLRLPGSDDDGTNPEQLFALGYAACFEGALGAVARRRRVELGTVETAAKVHLQTTEDRAFEIAVELDVTLPELGDADEAVAIVAAAHEVCPYSRAIRGNVGIKLSANGRPVEAHAATP